MNYRLKRGTDMTKITPAMIRADIEMYESYRAEAQKLGDTGVVEFCSDVLDDLWADMVSLIRAEMLPGDYAYTSDADIRYFESMDDYDDCEYPSA